jgi:hypothetical protein
VSENQANENMTIYEQSRTVPSEALRKIEAGRLKGMSDINPMWRIKKLTELFGMCGVGWKTIITEKRLEQGSEGQVVCFVDIELYVKVDGEWSAPIPGMGGSSFIAKERNGMYTSDECFKMAYTDAISVACKSLGFAADVYFEKDRTKYSGNGEETEKAEEEKFLRDCKVKWQTLAGSLDGFEEWHKKHTAEGATNKQLNAALAKKLLAKNQKESA